MNYFTYKDAPRGYWLNFRPVKLDTSGPFNSESFSMFDPNALKFLVLPVKAAHAKKFATLVSLLGPKLLDLATLFAEGKKDAVRAALDETLSTAGVVSAAA